MNKTWRLSSRSPDSGGEMNQSKMLISFTHAVRRSYGANGSTEVNLGWERGLLIDDLIEEDLEVSLGT